MDEQQAIGLVVKLIRSRRLDYPTDGLVADRFEAGWSVYAPVDVDESDPMAFLDMPVGRSVFLVGDSGRIKETSSSVPPGVAEAEFVAEERAARRPPSADQEFMAEFKKAFTELDTDGAISDFTIVDSPAPDEATAERAAELIAPIVQQLAQLGPPGWRRLGAVFSCTVSADIAQMRFWTDHAMDPLPVPEPIIELARRHRHIAAGMSAGPWFRALLTVRRDQSDSVEVTSAFDYGDERLPERDLLAPEHYRNDLATYPRPQVPAWLAEYIDGTGGAGPVGPRHEQPTRSPQPSAPNSPQPRDQAEISADLREIGNDAKLGNLWGSYPAGLLPSSRLGGLGIAAAVLALLGIVMLASSNALGAVVLVIAATLVVYIVRGAAVNSQHSGACLATFEAGMVYIDHQGQDHVFHWDSTTVRQRIVHYTRAGSRTRTSYEYRLTGPDGATLTLSQSSNLAGLANPEKWGPEIQDGITRAQLPGALRTIAGGGTITFGPIQLDSEAVTARGSSVPWSDIDQIKVVQGHVSLRVAGRWLSLINTEVSKVPNFFVFHTLAEHLRAAAH